MIDSNDYVILSRYILNIIDKFPKSTVPESPTPKPTPTPTSEPTPGTPAPGPTSEPVNVGAYPDWDRVRASYATYTGSGYAGGSLPP